MIMNAGGALPKQEAVVVNENLILNCDMQKGIISTKDSYLDLKSGKSKVDTYSCVDF